MDLSRRRLLALAASLPFARVLTCGDPVAATAGLEATLGRRAASVPPGASSFRSIPPARFADTRPEQGIGGYTRLDASTIRVQVGGRDGVPNGATAAVLNVAAVNTQTSSYVTVYPAGTPRPGSSNINVERAGQILSNLVTVTLGTGAGEAGAVDVYTQTPCDLVVDVNGAYAPVSDVVAAGRYIGLESAHRVLDTRDGAGKVTQGATVRVDLGDVVPAGASAVVVNLTVTESNGGGFWAAYPAGGPVPNSSSVNTDNQDQTRANQAILPLGQVGGVRGIDVFSSTGGHLIVDVAGYFTGPTDGAGSDGLFVANSPYRALDTRSNPALGRMYAGWIAEFDFAGRSLAQAVVVNLTATETRRAGYFTGYPARTERPLASNLNASAANQTIANHAILRTSTAGVAVYTQSGSSLVVDVAGYFVGLPTPAPLPPPLNIVPPPPPPAAPPYTISMPRLGRVGTVLEGVGSNVVDGGYIGHWPGTGIVGENSHMVLFAHRTTHGGILRYLHTFVPGDEITIRATDGRVFRYGYSRRDITGERATDIYNVGLASDLPSLSLVACSRTDYLPTDVRFRLVVTFSLLSVSEG